MLLAAWKVKAGRLKEEVYALYLALGDRRTPWYARILPAVIVAYAVSPIDIIPDFIPLLGYLDDLILVPAGIYASVKLIPQEVMEECRARAKVERIPRKAGWIAAGVIVLIWTAVIYGIVRMLTTR